MDEPLADDNWIAEYGREVYEAEQRNQALQNRFDNIEAVSKVTGRLVSNSIFNKNLTAIL